MRQQIRRPEWKLVACLLCCVATRCDASSFENKTGPNENNSPRVFSPRMDYDEWTPLGRGDPLKNDPTFDYVPPILDRVQYWMDGHPTTESSTSRSDILVLGVTAKKTSPKLPEQFFKFVNGPKFVRSPDGQGGYVADFTGSRGAEPPKVLRRTSFRNGPKDFRNQENYFPGSSYYNQNRKPETMMMPPPVIRNLEAGRPHQVYEIPGKAHQYLEKNRYSTQTEAGPVLQLKPQTYDHHQSYPLQDASIVEKPPRRHNQLSPERQRLTTKETSISHIETIKSYSPSPNLGGTRIRPESTTPSVTSVKSNLVYESTETISGGWFAKNRLPTQPSLPDPEEVTWNPNPAFDNTPDHNFYDHQASGSSHHEVLLGPNANIIVEGDTGDREEIVLGQKEPVPPIREPDQGDSPKVPGTESGNMFIVVANSSPSAEAIGRTEKEEVVTVVMPEKNLEDEATSTSLDDEEPVRTTSKPLGERLMTEIEAGNEKNVNHRPFAGSFGKPQGFIRPMDPPNRYPQAPNRFPAQNLLTDHRNHHQPSHSRPPPQINRFSPMGMAITLQNPPTHPLRQGIKPMGHVEPMHPLRTMIMAHQENQPHRVHQQHFGQSTPTTGSLDAFGPSMIPPLGNSIRDLLLKNEAQGNTQKAQDTVEMTTSMPSRIANDDSTDSEGNSTEKNSQINLMGNEDHSGGQNGPANEATTSSNDISVTTPHTMTTDPIFSHYKQPANPMRGPMYLIIQGHSKVKTYKPWVDKHGNLVEKNGDIGITTTTKKVSDFEKFVEENTRKIDEARRINLARETTQRPKETNNRIHSLVSLVDSGLGAIPTATEPPNRHDNNHNSVTNSDES